MKVDYLALSDHARGMFETDDELDALDALLERSRGPSPVPVRTSLGSFLMIEGCRRETSLDISRVRATSWSRP